MSEFKFEIVKKIGLLSKSDSGWAKELNLIKWNEREPKYDIRDWSQGGEMMGKSSNPPKIPRWSAELFEPRRMPFQAGNRQFSCALRRPQASISHIDDVSRRCLNK